ncbi:MAG TPA: carboxypeptidase-like regulatory domain-containing protein [Bacteroidales bacterium]|nr:carboxypeptidase-like regulatory domain-containing protein [Bacteroidales bacterium]
MLSRYGLIFAKTKYSAIFLLLLLSVEGSCQKTILDSLLTFSSGQVKTITALEIITKQTGYNFSYDSRLIDTEKITDLTFNSVILRTILENITDNDSLEFSVINSYIIFSRRAKSIPGKVESIPEVELDYITGTITDSESGEALPYATIALKNKGKGTVTNNNGEFGMKIARDMMNDTLSFSYLGYLNREIPVSEALGNNLKIRMDREFISIPGIIIRNQIPQEIINKALRAIHDNYSKDPVYLTGFYREGVLKRRFLQNYSEAILKIYKTSYTGAILGEQIKVLKSRKIENTGKKDTLTVRLKAGLNTCNALDGVKNTFDFINSESMQDYSYRMTDIVTYEDESAYAVEFEQKENVDLPLYKGTVYINTVDYSILNAEFELNEAFLFKMKDSFVANSTRGFNTWPVSVKYSVSYRKVNGIYYLSHVRGDLRFASKKRKRVFNSEFTVFFELAVTDIDLINVKRFDRDEVAPVHSVFSKVMTGYDPLFWGSQDFLRPEDNLLNELKNMKVNLQEFSGSDN